MGSQRVGVTFTTHNKSTEHTKAKSVHRNLGVFDTASSQGECSLQKTWTDPALPERKSKNNNKAYMTSKVVEAEVSNLIWA